MNFELVHFLIVAWMAIAALFKVVWTSSLRKFQQGIITEKDKTDNVKNLVTFDYQSISVGFFVFAIVFFLATWRHLLLFSKQNGHSDYTLPSGMSKR
jgi:hypothetical protein